MAEEELSKISASLASITLNIDKLTDGQKGIEYRLKSLEESSDGLIHMRREKLQPNPSSGGEEEFNGGQTGFRASDHANFDALGPLDDEGREAADGIKDFEKVKNQLQNIELPNDLRLFDSQSGISRDGQNVLKVIRRCARYTETGLRWVGKLSQRHGPINITHSDIQQLFVILSSQINFLQSEYAALVVKSTFNEETARLYRSFDNNQAAFSPLQLQHVRIAADLASIQARHGSASRGRGRGRSRGNYRGFSNRGMEDGFSHLSRRNIPTQRSESGQSSEDQA